MKCSFKFLVEISKRLPKFKRRIDMPITRFVKEIISSVRGIGILPETEKSIELSKEEEEELENKCDEIIFQSGPWDKEFTLEIYQFIELPTFVTNSIVKRKEFKKVGGEYKEVVTWIIDSTRFWNLLKKKYDVKEIKSFRTRSIDLRKEIKNIIDDKS